MGFGEVRLCLRQDEQRLRPALLAPPVVDPPQSVLDGLAGFALPESLRRQAVGLLMSQPKADPDRRRSHDHQRADQQRRGRPLPGPLDSALGNTDRAGLDRLACQEAPEVLGQVRRTGVAAAGDLVRALEADRLQVARHSGV
jgi:hypothetical protein